MADINAIVGRIGDMPQRNKVVLLVVLALVITSVILFSSWLQKADYQLLYANLSQDDAGLIMQQLAEMKVPYKATAGGIMVPGDKVHELKLQLAGQGLPQGGAVGFEIFDKTSFTMTDFVQKMNYRRALQGELSRTIRSLSEVEQCRVHIAVPEKTLFATEEERPKASVLLKLRPGRVLTQGQVHGIVHLVSSSVDGLASKDVAVVDSSGHILTAPTDSIAGMSGSQIDYQRSIEKELETRAVAILEPVAGKGKVKAKVAAAIDFTRVEKMEERFDPDSQVVRSEQKNIEKSSSGSAGGVPGVASNLPNRGQGQTAATQGQSEKKSETTNYEISKITSRIVNATGDIKRLSVIVLVDGTYTAQQNTAEKNYAPRSEEDILKFEDMVKKAVGFSTDRGDEVRVVNMPFETTVQEEIGEEKTDIMPVVITVLKFLVPLIAIALLFLFVVRPLMKILASPAAGVPSTRLALPQSVAELERAIAASELPDKERVIEWARKNPAEATNLIRTWIEEK